MSTVASHTSFLEGLAREECRLLNCKEHHRTAADGSAATAGAEEIGNMDVDEEEQLEEERRRQFLLVDFSSHDDDDDAIMSESDYFSSDDEDEILDENLEGDDGDNEDDESDVHDVIDIDALSDDDDVDDDNNSESDDDDDAIDDIGDDQSNSDEMEITQNETATTQTTTQQQDYALSSMLPNDMASSIGCLLVSLSNSEEVPLIRADIPWSIISSCDAPLLTTLYKRSTDLTGSLLLQGVLRMDPPLMAVQKIIDAFPSSCVDMEGFFTACQFAQPRTSSQQLHSLNFYTDGKMTHDDDDVGEVVKLIMHRTILARRSNNIGWSMVAFLGEFIYCSIISVSSNGWALFLF